MDKIINGQNWRIGCHALVPVSGRVAVVRVHNDLSKVCEGDILVAKQADINYTPQMLIVAAIIVEEGSRYSHAVTFAREHNIPCLIGAVGITDELKDGNMILINTYAKTVKVEKE